MKRRYIIMLTILIAAGMLVAACGPVVTQTPSGEPTLVASPVATPPEEVTGPTEQEPPAEEEKVVLRVGQVEDYDCWNPWSCSSTWDKGYIVYEGLADHGPVPGCDGVPSLADSWEVSKDGRTWTINLHEGITSSDGEPFDAHTAVDYINWFNSTDLKYWFAETLYMESVEAVDDLTFRYTTSEPILNSPNYSFQWWLFLPPHIWGALDQDTLYSYDNYPPIATGPYVVTEHVPGSYIIFDAREDYYRGKPPIDRIVVQLYANMDAVVNAFVAGEIDMTYEEMPPEAYELLKSAPNAVVEERPPGGVHFLAFNMHVDGNKHPAVEDPVVREAIDYAIDKQLLLDVALLGHGVLCPTNWACGPNYADQLNPDLKVTPFDLDHANQLLEEAAYIDTDGDGIRETPDGQPLEFRFYFESEVPPALTITDYLKGWFKEIGIAITPEAFDSATWNDFVLNERDFDIGLGYQGIDIDAAAIDYELSCWTADAGTSAYNDPGYCNEEMDDLVYEYWLNADKEAAYEALFAAEEIINNDRPQIFLVGQNQIQAYNGSKFTFPEMPCDISTGFWSHWSLLRAEVK
jgi:peptide/nickel transport system substrate-binding protein